MMSKNKKRLTALIVMFSVLVFAVSYAAANSEGLKSVKVVIGGKELNVPSFLVDGRTMVPLRTIVEALGARVDWNADTETASVNKVGTVTDYGPEGGLMIDLKDMVDPKHTALLVIDMQNDFIGTKGYCANLGIDVSAGRAIIPALNNMIAKAREAGTYVIFIRTTHSTATDTPPYMSRYAARGFDMSKPLLCQEGTWGADLDPELTQPNKNERLVTKYTYDAFQDTDLGALLKNKEIKTVITTGVNTNLCVQTTAERAFAEGYYLVVPKDCVASTDAKLHDAALLNFDQYFGKVVPSEDIYAAWNK